MHYQNKGPILCITKAVRLAANQSSSTQIIMTNQEMFIAAHKIAKQTNRKGYSYAATFAAALRYVINVLAPLKAQIKAELRNGINAFRFLKADGKTERLAFGTLDSSLYDYQPKGSGRKGCPLTVSYWDLEKKAFRCFNLLRFIEMLPKCGDRIILSQDKDGLCELAFKEELSTAYFVKTEMHDEFGDTSSQWVALKDFNVNQYLTQLQKETLQRFEDVQLDQLPF